MVKIVAQPHLHLDDKQQASGSLRLTTNHGNCAYSVRITDAAVKDGDALKGLRLGMKLDDGSLEALYEPANGHHLFRVQRTVQVRFGNPHYCAFGCRRA